MSAGRPPAELDARELFHAVLVGTRRFAAACADAGRGGREPVEHPAVLAAGVELDELLAEVELRLDQLGQLFIEGPGRPARPVSLPPHVGYDPLTGELFQLPAAARERSSIHPG